MSPTLGTYNSIRVLSEYGILKQTTVYANCNDMIHDRTILRLGY